MKIKGAFTVRWKPKDGDDGTGVSVVSSVQKWAASQSGTTRPTSGWQESVPSVAQGWYVWSWLHTVYSDGSVTDMYGVSRHGIDGKGIKSSTVTYCLKANTNTRPENFASSDWGSFPQSLTDGYWLYTRTHIVYSDDNSIDSYSVAQVGVGSYYAGVQEYYAAFASATEIPSGSEPPQEKTYVQGETLSINTEVWKTTRPTLDNSTPYLWNFEISRDSRGNQYVTKAICIGNFAKGIVSIVETYAISSMGAAENGRDYPSDITEQMWTDESQAAAPTEAKRYQWNKTVVTYNSGSPDVFYHVSAVKGVDGVGAIYIDLDNENASLLYDGNGTLIGGENGYKTSQCRLYDNGQDVTDAFVSGGGQFVIYQKSSTVSASMTSASVLRVTGITSDTGYVLVRALYKNAWYYAKMELLRVVGRDVYELEVSPNAISYNTQSGEASATQIAVKVYRMAQNGSRQLVPSLSTYNLALYYVLNGGSNEQSLSSNYNSGATWSNHPANYTSVRFVLRNSGGDLLDYETVPVAKVVNGQQGFSVVTSVQKDSFTEAQWATYGTVGHSETWSNTSDIRNGARVGDLFTVVGKATDTGNGHTATYRCTNASGDLEGTCISHEVTKAGENAVGYEIVFEEAWARIDQNGVITARLKGIAYKVEGATRERMVGTTVRCGYIPSDGDTFASWQTDGNGRFDCDSWFDGDEVDDYAKGSKVIFASLIVGGDAVYTMFFTMVPDGADGESYQPLHKGIFRDDTAYTWGNGTRDFVDYSPDGTTYYRYGVRSHGTVQAGTVPETNGEVSSKWVKLHVIQTLITNCIFGTNANIGGFITSNQQMRSTSVDEDNEPNLLLDGANGSIVAKKANIKGIIQAQSLYLGYQNATEGAVIDPAKGCAIGMPFGIGAKVYLPRANQYPFLTLTFYNYIPSNTAQSISNIWAQTGDSILVYSNLKTSVGTYRKYCQGFMPIYNHVIRLHAINGSWCLECDESKLTYFYDENENRLTKV